MVWTTPSGAFAAHHPPAWLKRDMQLAETQLPGVQVFVAFLNDLPEWDALRKLRELRNTSFVDAENYKAAKAQIVPGAQFKIYPQRREKMAALCHKAFGPSEAFTAIAKDVGSKVHAGTMADVATLVQLMPNSLIGADDQWLLHQAFPSQAVILLDERGLTAKQHLAQQLGLSDWMCDVPAAVNLHRGQFWHEVHHLRAKFVDDAWTPRRREELACDKHAMAMCAQQGDSATAGYQLGLRTLVSFVTGVGTAPYWYPLSLNGVAVDEAQELQAVVNIKAAALGMHGAPAPEVLPLYESDSGMRSDARLRDLQRNVSSIEGAVSEQLAQHTLAMAQRYVPGALTRQIKLG